MIVRGRGNIMSSFEIIIDKSIEGAITRIIQDELGEISVQITRTQKTNYLIEIQEGIEITNEQKILIRDAIISIFDSQGLIVSFQAWTE